MPLWLTVTIIGRDISAAGGMVVIQLTVGKVKVRPRVVGKVATVLQMVVVLWVLSWEEAWEAWNCLATALFTGASGLLYVWDGVRQFSVHPSRLPTGGRKSDHRI